MKPALSRDQRTGAWVAGAVGYALWATGSLLAFGILTILIGTLLFGAFFGGISFLFGGEGGLADFGDDVPADLGILAWTALGVAVLGAAMLVIGVLASGRILRRAGHARPTAVTWAGIGIAAIPNLLLFWIVTFPVVSALGLDTAVSMVVATAVSAAIAAVIGALAWWWMAHALRPHATMNG